MNTNANNTTDIASSDPPLESRSVTNPAIQTSRQRRRKKCHGHKQRRRFRRRRYKRGMTKEEVDKRLQAPKRAKKKQKVKQSQNVTASTTTVDQKETTATSASIPKKQDVNQNQVKHVVPNNKRKRDISSQDLHRHLLPSSASNQLNIRPPTIKKMKRISFIQSIPVNSISMNKNYPMPAYLTHSPHLIFQALRQEFNCSLNKKDEQIFIHLRLQLFDRQFRLELDQHLWQSYLNLFHQDNLWPHQLYEMAKTNQPNICQQYVRIQLETINGQLKQCNKELIRQAETSRSILLPSLDIMDMNLKNYVSLQQNYLIQRNDHQLIRCKNDIRDQQLYRQLFTDNLITIQREVLQQLIDLKRAQLEVYEEFIMLEQRILYQFLPPNFDQFEKITAPDFYWPHIADCTLVLIKRKRRNILKQGKRTLLNIFYAAYEYKIEEYEQQYQQGLKEFQSRFPNTIQINEISLIDAFKTYIVLHTNRIIHDILNKIAHFREIIAQRYQRSSSTKKMVGVSPEVTIDVLHCPFKADELSYLSLGESYIRPNQSALRREEHRETQIKNEVEDIREKVHRQIKNYCKREPPKAMMDHYCELIGNRLRQRFMAPLSYVDFMRAQREFRLVKSIRRKARKAKLIIRVCDKGGGLHIGSKSDYERKAAKYREDTKAYQELSYNPLKEMITNVTNALNVMKQNKELTNYNYSRLVPNPEHVKLSYKYYNPKPHKVDPLAGCL
ncbi:unnamed protein product [Rotaria sp. Silwood1]|nr:unnamed protein product [Rotaria sp. Silwood1]